MRPAPALRSTPERRAIWLAQRHVPEMIGAPATWPKAYQLSFPLNSAGRNKLTALFYINGIDPEMIEAISAHPKMFTCPEGRKGWITNLHRLMHSQKYRARVYAYDIVMKCDVFANGKRRGPCYPRMYLSDCVADVKVANGRRIATALVPALSANFWDSIEDERNCWNKCLK